MSGLVGGFGSKAGVIGMVSGLDRPSWCSNRHGESDFNSQSIITWNHADPDHNIGGCMKTDDIFYCPVEGVYQVYVHSMGSNPTTTSDQNFRLKIDGSYGAGSKLYESYRSGGSGAPNHHPFACFQQLVKLNGGQTIAIWNAGAGMVYGGHYTVGLIRLLA
tara:strand:+ start:847 stop:1329 length:483 start_codon:yes stop_codon:yes gene_type:complete